MKLETKIILLIAFLIGIPTIALGLSKTVEFVNNGYKLGFCHLHIAASTTQTIAVVNTPQEIQWGEITDEDCDWLITDGVPSPTSTIPITGSYDVHIEAQVETTTGGSHDMEFKLLNNGAEIDWTGKQRTISNSKDIGSVSLHLNEDFIAGDEITVQMSGDNTALEITATSSSFTNMPTATLTIQQVDGE